MSELSPCPFCGYEANLDGNGTLHYVKCARCGSVGVRSIDEDVAIDAWNTRAERMCENNAPDYLDFLCSECGFVHYHSEANDTGEGNEWNYCPNCGSRIIGGNE